MVSMHVMISLFTNVSGRFFLPSPVDSLQHKKTSARPHSKKVSEVGGAGVSVGFMAQHSLPRALPSSQERGLGGGGDGRGCSCASASLRRRSHSGGEGGRGAKGGPTSTRGSTGLGGRERTSSRRACSARNWSSMRMSLSSVTACVFPGANIHIVTVTSHCHTHSTCCGAQKGFPMNDGLRGRENRQ